MKLLAYILFSLLSLSCFGFEGIVHCTKTENGSVTEFDFYIKGSQIAIEYKNGNEYYKILFNRQTQEVKICMDSPQIPEKGYYLIRQSDAADMKPVTTYFKRELAPLLIDEASCQGYVHSSDLGTAQAYVSKTEVDLTGFSTFFRDPVYELIDAFKLKFLPVRLSVQKTTGNYTIEMAAQEKTLDASLFEVPSGYKQFTVTTTAK